MMMHKKTKTGDSVTRFSALLVLVMALGGCGGSDSGDLVSEDPGSDSGDNVSSPGSGTGSGSGTDGEQSGDSVSFQGAEPAQIGLKGTAQAGVEETSTLSFLVKDNNGDPVGSGVSVESEVLSGAGGFSIVSDTVTTTNSDGIATVTVTSGSVPTVATVGATVSVGSGTSTGQGSVSIQGGIASQDRFSIALGTINPPAGSEQGVTVDVDVRAADRWGNPVPDGTQVNFSTELGDIEASCETQAGGCAATWTSQGPDSQNYDQNRHTRTCFAGGGTEQAAQGLPGVLPCSEFARFGRSTILAYATGEESFDDEDGDNLYDDGENVVNLPEAFLDYNETGLRDPQPSATAPPFFEDFVDFNEDGSYDQADPDFRGVGCDDATSQDCQGLANVRDSQVLALSTDQLQMRIFAPKTTFGSYTWHKAGDPASPPTQWGGTAFSGADVTGVNTGKYNLGGPYGEQLTKINADGSGTSITVHLADANGNAPPAGTTISVQGGSYTVFGQSQCEVQNTTEPVFCTFELGVPGYDSTDPPDDAPIVIEVAGDSAPFSKVLPVSFPAPP